MQHAAQCRPGLAVGTDARCRSPASSRLHCSHCHTHAVTLQPQQLHQRADARQPLAVCAGAQQQLGLSGLKASNSSEAAELKSRIADLAGSKNGNDLPTKRHAEVKQLLQQLESMNPARKVYDIGGLNNEICMSHLFPMCKQPNRLAFTLTRVRTRDPLSILSRCTIIPGLAVLVQSPLDRPSVALQPATVDLAGTTWKLVYTTSTAASSGKLGPFVGLVQQVWSVEAVLMLKAVQD